MEVFKPFWHTLAFVMIARWKRMEEKDVSISAVYLAKTIKKASPFAREAVFPPFYKNAVLVRFVLCPILLEATFIFY
tara:strand:- start:64075 stop:64305 length:231 start_codon:yes stop_codon:yes gene_type:complete